MKNEEIKKIIKDVDMGGGVGGGEG